MDITDRKLKSSLFNINHIMVNTHRPTLSTMQRAKMFGQFRRFHESNGNKINDAYMMGHFLSHRNNDGNGNVFQGLI